MISGLFDNGKSELRQKLLDMNNSLRLAEHRADRAEEQSAKLSQMLNEHDAKLKIRLLRCAFCGKDEHSVLLMVKGDHPLMCICNECVELCHQIVAEKRSAP